MKRIIEEIKIKWLALIGKCEHKRKDKILFFGEGKDFIPFCLDCKKYISKVIK
jgi:hypothetical protein